MDVRGQWLSGNATEIKKQVEDILNCLLDKNQELVFEEREATKMNSSLVNEKPQYGGTLMVRLKRKGFEPKFDTFRDLAVFESTNKFGESVIARVPATDTDRYNYRESQSVVFRWDLS